MGYFESIFLLKKNILFGVITISSIRSFLWTDCILLIGENIERPIFKILLLHNVINLS